MRIETYQIGEKAKLTAYILDAGLKFGQSMNHPGILILPGGGYIYLSPREGEPVALDFAAKGFHAFVLEYSLGYDVAGFKPLEETDAAMELIRAHAEEWHLAKDHIAVIGFSAGGHLALAECLYGKNRPDAMVLAYPGISDTPSPADFMTKMLAGKDPDPELVKKLDLFGNLNSDLPPAFVFSTGGDSLTKTSTLKLCLKLDEMKVPFEYHLFGFGPHGYSTAEEAAADGSSQVLDPHAATWVKLCTEWLIQTFGGLEFADISTSHIMEAAKKLGINFAAMTGVDAVKHA